MKVVIEVSAEVFNDLQYLEYIITGLRNKHSEKLLFSLINAIHNGMVLPEGHGRLIEQPTDADIAETIGGQNDFADCIREAVATVFENAETVIEADAERITTI